MKNTKNLPMPKTKRPQTLKQIRSLLFSLLVVSCAAAVSAGNFIPVRAFLAAAQQEEKAKDTPPDNNGQRAERISERARKQIESLMLEKSGRTRGRRKMDSQLIYGLKRHRREKIADDVDSLEVKLPFNNAGEVMVDITANVDKELISKLKSAGVKIISAHPQYNSIRATLNLDTLDTISDFPEITFIQPKQEAMTSQEETSQTGEETIDPEHLRTTRPGFEERESNISDELMQALEEFQANSYNLGTAGVRKSEADKTHKADVARNTYGFDGSGVKIGILSDGVRNLAASQASGDIGPVTVLTGQSGTSAGQCATTSACDEGTAMLELVHDIAPGAQLFFATALGGSANMANNIRNLRTAGCDIIVDDVFYFGESPFQDGQAPGIISSTNGGVIMQAVNDVTASGALYFSSAGNSGNKNDGTSGVWEGDFVDGGDAPAILGGAAAGRVHQFPGGATFDTVTAVGSSQYNLNWSDPLGGSGNDYDLFALNAAGTAVIAASTSSQSGTQDPFEAIGPAPANSRLVIVKFSGVGRYLRLTTNRGRLAVSTAGQTTGHSCALNAFGVAATAVVGPFPNPFSASNQVETFSSDGPRRLFYNANGTPKTPGNVSATGGELRQKPDITAADGASVTGAGGFGISFFGTSAAAPHAGAIAALLKSANPSLTPAQVRDALQNTAIDNEAAGVDRDSGYGIIMADAALQYIGASPSAANVTLGTVTVSEVGGNGNGFIEPGERGTLSVPLLNTGVISASNVTATISSATTGVSVTPSSSRAYPDLAATNGSAAGATPFEFVYQQTAPYAANINFVLTVNYNGITRSYPFIVPTGQLSNSSTVLDTTAPVVPAGATSATTGLQTSRMAFTFPISSCGTPKASPGAFASTATRRYDAYTYTNTSASPICVTVNLTHSASALLYVDAYIPNFVPTSVGTNFVADNGGSTTSGAGTTQLFSFNVPANQTFTVVVSESNQNGGLNVPYNLRVTGLPGAPVPANLAPVNAVPAAQTVLEDNALAFSGAGANPTSISDADAGNNTTEVTLSATNGVMTLGGTTGLTFTNGDGAGDQTMTFAGSITDINNALNGLSYSPATDFNGASSLSITTNDNGSTGTGGAQSDTDTVAINVTPVNDTPSFTVGANQTVLEDAGAQTIANWATNLSAGPTDEAAQALSFVATNDNNSLFSVQPTVAPDGTLAYTPALNANGSATVTVIIKDDGGTDNGGMDTSARQTFTVNVTPVNDAPTADAQSVSTGEDNALNILLTGSDVETPASSLSFTVVSNPAHGTLSGIAPNLTYTPAANFNGSDSFTFKATDTGDGASAALSSSETTVSIIVTAINDGPTAASQSVATGEDTAKSITLSGSDVETALANLSYTITTAPAHGTLTGTAPNLTYVPNLNYNGTDSFQFTVTDTGDGASPALTSAPATVSIAISPVNDAPTANAGPDQTVECSGAVTLNGSGSSDLDGDTPLTYAWREGTNVLGTGATLNTVLAFGSHTITLRVTDPSGAFSEDTLIVNVIDTTAPTITSNGRIISLTTHNKKYQQINVADLIASASDACDLSVNLNRVVIMKVTSDEGSISDKDIVIGADCKSVQLRADVDNSGKGHSNGRVYTITFKVRDTAGNTTTMTRQVIVPHDQGNGSNAIDDGVAYTVTSSCQ